MSKPSIAPYGSWKSPITADLIVAGTIGLGQIALDGAEIYWLESRPTEGGRNVLVRRSSNGETQDGTPLPFNVRTRVHEYGGGAYQVHNGVVYFSNFSDQGVYQLSPGTAPLLLTAPGFRYADGVVDDRRQRFICVREDHTQNRPEPTNTIASLPTQPDAQAENILVSGNDFYSSPRLSPDGQWLAWITWNHPNMPWDGTELWVASLTEEGTISQAQKIAGGLDESIVQPQWSPDGQLYFVSDRTGWWNLYHWNPATSEGNGEVLLAMAAEFSEPHWIFGMSTYGFASATEIICTYYQNGFQVLARFDTQTCQLHSFDLPYTSLGGVQVGSDQVVFIGASPTVAARVVRLDLATGESQVLRQSSDLAVDPAYLSVPQAIEFPTENGLTAYAFYYPPQNQDHTAPSGELPPLLVKSHGGPTAATSTALNLKIQYWTSRGIAVLDVNYGGSTGYGRAYRQRLQGQWGIVDVDDCANGAKDLVNQGQVDGDRLLIDGGSAGGYTTLCALTFRDTFKAGASYYGVSDLEALAKDTHKFEARYLDGLIGPYPERQDLYQERSPVHAADRLSCPVIFFQGLEDRVVPPNQAERMVEVLRAKGLPVAYVAYEGEQHGFRRAENIKRTLEGELYFYSRVFGFKLAEPVEPVVIENLAE
ncbi:MAG: S9 family peptidase [Leptolyngbyaceae cyanobacterium bins.59]|nr:S9 family peptidase [Leptolyngbyaceae cyanobacterium bins.59]